MRVSYSTKIWISIAILSVGTAICSVSYLYLRSRTLVLEQMGGRLADIGRTAVEYFGPDEIEKLKRLRIAGEEAAVPYNLVAQGMSPGEFRESLPLEKSEEVMQSEDFLSIVSILRKIKENTKFISTGREERAGKPAIRFASILTTVAEDKERKILRFLADADYNDHEDPNPFGNLLYGNSEALLWALSGQVAADKDFRYEEGQHLLSAGIPIFDTDNKPLAILALDYDANSEVNAVNDLLYWSWAIVLISFVLSLLLAMLISRMLNRPIEILRVGAERVRGKDFSARVQVNSQDELGLLGSAFNGMVEEIQLYAKNLETTNSAFARFVPREFLKQLGHESVTEVCLGDHVQRQMTVLFTDIRAFSTITEYMSPRDSFDFINEYLRSVSPIIRRHGGFIDKYIGDAIMALFPDGAQDAINAAIDMQKALEEFNSSGIELGRVAIEIGIGIHHGNLMLGTVGETERMDGTVISDAVNLASRLESLTKEYYAGIIVSERALRSILQKDQIYSRYLGTVKVKGKQNVVEIYEVIANQNSDIVRYKIASREKFEIAVRALEEHKNQEALEILENIIKNNPHDKTAVYMFERCKRSRKKKIKNKPTLVKGHLTRIAE